MPPCWPCSYPPATYFSTCRCFGPWVWSWGYSQLMHLSWFHWILSKVAWLSCLWKHLGNLLLICSIPLLSLNSFMLVSLLIVGDGFVGMGSDVRIPSVWFFYCTIVKLSKKLFYTVIIAKLRFLAFCSFFWIAIWVKYWGSYERLKFGHFV